MSVVYVAFGLIAISFIAVITIVIAPTVRHKQENQKLLDSYIAQNKKNNTNCLLLEHLVMREQTYHRTYFIWQTLSKVSGILSILLSVCTLVIPNDVPMFFSQLFTLLSILFVIFALYLLPEHKYKDYLFAYRKCGALIAKVITNKIDIIDYAEYIEKIEDSLNSDIE